MGGGRKGEPENQELKDVVLGQRGHARPDASNRSGTIHHVVEDQGGPDDIQDVKTEDHPLPRGNGEHAGTRTE